MQRIKPKNCLCNRFLYLAIICGISISGFNIYKSIKLNNYYLEQLRFACSRELNSKTQDWGEMSLNIIESHMIHDGYNMAQISEMRNKAYEIAYEKKELTKKYLDKSTGS